MPLSESKVQTKIIKAMNKAGWYTNKIIQTSKNGWPDLEASRAGVHVKVECKKEDGHNYSPLQKLRKIELERVGIKVYWANCLNDIKELI